MAASLSEPIGNSGLQSRPDIGGRHRTRASCCPFYKQTTPRGYETGTSARACAGISRARLARRDASICRNYVILSDPTCPPVPLPNLHGKEGVSGSSPEEGLPAFPESKPILTSAGKRLGA